MVDPLKAVDPFRLYYFLFLVYVTFFVFMVTNIITSVFVESALQVSSKDEMLIVHDQLSKQQYYIDKMKSLFKKIDTDGSGELSYKELKTHLHDGQIHAFCSSLDID